MSELQPGMLALIYGLVVDTEFNGMMVALSYQVTPENIGDFDDADIGDWVVECGGEEEGTFNQKNLLPIFWSRPEVDPLHEKQQQELHA